MSKLIRPWTRVAVLLFLPVLALVPAWRMLGCISAVTPVVMSSHHHDGHDMPSDAPDQAGHGHCCLLAPCEAPWTPTAAAFGPVPVGVQRDRDAALPLPRSPARPSTRIQPPSTAPPL